MFKLTTKSFKAVLCSGLSSDGFFSLGAGGGGGVACVVVTCTSGVVDIAPESASPLLPAAGCDFSGSTASDPDPAATEDGMATDGGLLPRSRRWRLRR